jgi:GT2 family glycosyltransferase
MSAPVVQSTIKAHIATVRVAAIIATYNRPVVVARLVRSMAREGYIGVICVVDNGSDPAVKKSLESLDGRIRYIDAGSNRGCGGGLALGFETVLPDKTITHFWILDDDAVLEHGCGTKLITAMEREGADLAVPFIYDARGKIGSFPGPLKGQAWQEIKKPITPADFVATCGSAPRNIFWATGVCILVSRRAVEQCGLPRTDYWLMGEDIEYTARISARFKAILVPEARAHHLPPPPKETSVEQARRYAYVKFCAHLTNNTYTSTALRHGWRVFRHLPGNYLRFFRENGWSPRNLLRAFRCFFWGAIRREPAGSARFQKFRAAMMQIPPAKST